MFPVFYCDKSRGRETLIQSWSQPKRPFVLERKYTGMVRLSGRFFPGRPLSRARALAQGFMQEQKASSEKS